MRCVELTESTTHPSLHDHNIFALPSVQHGHAGDGRTRLQGNGIDGVICSDHKRNVGVRKVIVDFVHLKN